MTKKEIQAAREFAQWLIETLGPDLEESGMVETSKDVIKAARLIEQLAEEIDLDTLRV